MASVIITDGGRAAAGFKGYGAGDCVARSIAVVARMPYRGVYDRLPLGLMPIHELANPAFGMSTGGSSGLPKNTSTIWRQRSPARSRMRGRMFCPTTRPGIRSGIGGCCCHCCCLSSR